jgi:hypothetical protein
MKLSGLHILLSYQCTYECDHCFVWGSPRQTGVLTLGQIREILSQACDHEGMEWIYFEGGEPFLYYPTLVEGIRLAHLRGFRVGLVTNGYWATSVEDAIHWLAPVNGRIHELSISRDDLHMGQERAEHAYLAARRLGIPADTISIRTTPCLDEMASKGQIPPGQSDVMHRGRAAEMLAWRAVQFAAERFDCCPHEDLRNPGRLHVDPFGNLHICQGISIGNLFERHLNEICERFDPQGDPVIGRLIEGGPAALAREENVSAPGTFADACHLCYEVRARLRDRFPAVLTPDNMYEVVTANGRNGSD